MPNRLAHETSPYLLQHRENPVDWYPWGDEAIARARREEKPIFLSIGYSACHWCHVMEHESFEDAGIARLLNERFVSIKVDREERPDLDQIYMNAVQMLTGRGGWPMSVFLTPDLKPFYGGTYFPPHESRGMPGFDQILSAVIDAWKHRREQVLSGAEQLAAELRKVGLSEEEGDAVRLSRALVDAAVAQLRRSFDAGHGGFGQAPKFPHSMDLELLVREAQRSGRSELLDMVRLTLDRMAAGGIYDHVGGGFARYSVDARWLVPHFEKMLYDNALLAGVYLDAFLVTGDSIYQRVVRETLDYVLRDMTDPAGGFYSTEDADSEGEEGLFYTWTPDELETVLGEAAADTFGRVYDVTDVGNFEGRNILHLPKTLAQNGALLKRTAEELAAELDESRRKLFVEREKRVRPGRDDKIIVAWNGLMIGTLARAGAALDEARYVAAAKKAADFILERVRGNDGQLLHTWRAGRAKLDAYLDDYAALAEALISVYEATFEERYLQESTRLLDVVLAKFADPASGGFFFTAADHEPLIARTKELTDSSTPSGNALAATALLRLGKFLGRREYLDAAEATLAAAAPVMERVPLAAGQMLLALDWYLGPSHELVLIGDLAARAGQLALRSIRAGFLPRCVVAASDPTRKAAAPDVLRDLFEGKETGEQPALFVCQDFVCEAPTVGTESIERRLTALATTKDAVRSCR